MSIVPEESKFTNSSFTSARDGSRDLVEGVSVQDFRRVFLVPNLGVSILRFYLNTAEDVIQPNSSIAGTYTCRSGQESQAVNVSVRSM